SIKKYPCCGSTHAAVDALLSLIRRHPVQAERVTRLEAWIHGRRLLHTDRPEPKTALDAKFSLQYCLARALASHGIDARHFEGDAFRDPDMRRLMQRIHTGARPDAQSPDNADGA